MAEFIKNEDGAYVLDLNDLEKWVDKVDRRLDAIEKNNEPEVVCSVEKMRALGNGIGIFSGSYVDEKLYNKLEAKHEADCRLISEYDLEIKKLEKQNSEQSNAICDLYSNLCTEQKERIRCEAVIKVKNDELFDLKNAENERDHYKGLYFSKCDDYDKVLEKQIKTEKELKHAEEVGANYNNLYSITCDKYDKLEEKYESINVDYIRLEKEYNTVFSTKNALEFKNTDLETKNSILTKENNKLRESKTDLVNRNTYLIGLNKNLEDENDTLKEKIHDAILHNKMRDDVYEKNLELKKKVDAKDREINFLRAELDKYTSGSEEDLED